MEENKQKKHRQRIKHTRSNHTPAAFESRANRLFKDLECLCSTPPTGISCVPVNEVQDHLIADIIGPEDTPYEGGLFKIDIKIPSRYPFEPPSVRFMTPIYHPNIDKSGRICLDTLKMPPEGTWTPCLNLSTVLMTVRLLMSSPGPQDPLMTEIWQEYTYNYVTFAEKARQHTKQYATENQVFAPADDLMTQSESGEDASANTVPKKNKSKKFSIYTPPDCPVMNTQVKMVEADQHHSPSTSLLDTKETASPPAADILCLSPPAAKITREQKDKMEENSSQDDELDIPKSEAMESSSLPLPANPAAGSAAPLLQNAEEDQHHSLSTSLLDVADTEKEASPPGADILCSLPPAAKITREQKDKMEENSCQDDELDIPKSEVMESSSLPLPANSAAGRAVGGTATNDSGNIPTGESCEVEASEQKQEKRRPCRSFKHFFLKIFK